MGLYRFFIWSHNYVLQTWYQKSYKLFQFFFKVLVLMFLNILGYCKFLSKSALMNYRIECSEVFIPYQRPKQLKNCFQIISTIMYHFFLWQINSPKLNPVNAIERETENTTALRKTVSVKLMLWLRTKNNEYTNVCSSILSY